MSRLDWPLPVMSILIGILWGLGVCYETVARSATLLNSDILGPYLLESGTMRILLFVSGLNWFLFLTEFNIVMKSLKCTS